MRTTRSQKERAEESPSHNQHTLEQSEEQPTSSFKGTLDKFKHDEDTTSNAQSTRSSNSSTRPPKRPKPTNSTTPSSPRPPKQRKTSKTSKYASPSKYAHLSPLVDILAPNLICIFIGTNPGVQTATSGHAYAHPSNHFWKLLHSSGLTDRRLSPTEDRSLPALYCMGNTNIVDRPSKDAAELSKEEMAMGTKALDEKVQRYKPEAVCIVGKGIWEAVWRYRYGRGMRKGEFRYGWQDEGENMGRGGDADEAEERDGEGKVWVGAKVFVTTSTSGLAASLKPAEKEAIWKPFGEWVKKRREERGFVPRVGDVVGESK